jgi:hypothetical protein
VEKVPEAVLNTTDVPNYLACGFIESQASMNGLQ